MQQNLKQSDDFKYILQDTSHVYIGKEFTYKELMEHDDVPFKLKAIISSYVSKDADLDEKVIDHLLYMTEDEFTYQIYKQIKMEIRLFYKEEKQTLFHKTKVQWVHKTCGLALFMEQYKEQVAKGTVIIEDIAVSKLALMLVSI